MSDKCGDDDNFSIHSPTSTEDEHEGTSFPDEEGNVNLRLQHSACTAESNLEHDARTRHENDVATSRTYSGPQDEIVGGRPHEAIHNGNNSGIDDDGALQSIVSLEPDDSVSATSNAAVTKAPETDDQVDGATTVEGLVEAPTIEGPTIEATVVERPDDVAPLAVGLAVDAPEKEGAVPDAFKVEETEATLDRANNVRGASAIVEAAEDGATDFKDANDEADTSEEAERSQPHGNNAADSEIGTRIDIECGGHTSSGSDVSNAMLAEGIVEANKDYDDEDSEVAAAAVKDTTTSDDCRANLSSAEASCAGAGAAAPRTEATTALCATGSVQQEEEGEIEERDDKKVQYDANEDIDVDHAPTSAASSVTALRGLLASCGLSATTCSELEGLGCESLAECSALTDEEFDAVFELMKSESTSIMDTWSFNWRFFVFFSASICTSFQF